ncbi:hypothetical protein PROFUN_11537 [Planoprotostelium fungivorum]|uniref:BTB domain-containing protein n=1 Tax=Planoprotostelium fungivorum TaxID=1890364 RepID=A0A2P6NA29_9EUKA|nr:hypothetical protein PROFUN_11537 [Planoprotostelium fungivorum]
MSLKFLRHKPKQDPHSRVHVAPRSASDVASESVDLNENPHTCSPSACTLSKCDRKFQSIGNVSRWRIVRSFGKDSKGRIVITLRQCSRESFLLAMGFVYSGVLRRIPSDLSQLQDLFDFAKDFQMEELLRWMTPKVTVQNPKEKFWGRMKKQIFREGQVNSSTDVIFHIGAASFPAHKVTSTPMHLDVDLIYKVLFAARSNYFQSLFTKQWMESGSTDIILQEIEPDVFRVIMQFIYSNEMKIEDDFSEEECYQLFRSSQYFGIKNMEHKCGHRMADLFLSPESVARLWNQARATDNETLYERCREYLVENFPAVSMQRDFSELELDLLKEVLQYGELEEGFDVIFAAIQRYARGYSERCGIDVRTVLIQLLPPKTLFNSRMKNHIAYNMFPIDAFLAAMFPDLQLEE